MKICFFCHSKNLVELIEDDNIKYFCGRCGKKFVRYFENEKINIIKNGKEIKHQAVKAIIKNNNGDILFIKRRTFPFTFSLPAGHIENDEIPEDAIKREVFEETGLLVKKMKLVYKGENLNDRCRAGANVHDWFVYECEAQGDLMENYESSFLRWIKPEEGILLVRNQTRKVLEEYVKNKVKNNGK